MNTQKKYKLTNGKMIYENLVETPFGNVRFLRNGIVVELSDGTKIFCAGFKNWIQKNRINGVSFKIDFDRQLAQQLMQELPQVN